MPGCGVYTTVNQNLENALHGLQEARAAIFVETGKDNTMEQEDALEAIQGLINEAESKINAY